MRMMPLAPVTVKVEVVLTPGLPSPQVAGLASGWGFTVDVEVTALRPAVLGGPDDGALSAACAGSPVRFPRTIFSNSSVVSTEMEARRPSTMRGAS